MNILYGLEIYANTYISCLDKLMKLNIEILRIIQNLPFCSHVNDLCTEFNLFLLDHLHTQQLLVLVLKCLFL